ncbi:hypothetical protein SPRA44_690014 [Serratia proteamaculans]|nr:hypothetical protein SPRA44_690014 [Serratia proteamaculans]
MSFMSTFVLTAVVFVSYCSRTLKCFLTVKTVNKRLSDNFYNKKLREGGVSILWVLKDVLATDTREFQLRLQL